MSDLFAPHALRHHPMCRDERGKLECVCGLGDRPVNDQVPDEDWYDPDDRMRERPYTHWGLGADEW